MATQLAVFVADSADQPLDAPVREIARRGILDWLGTAVAGSREAAGRIAAELDADIGGSAQATIIGSTRRASVTGAAFVNGVAGHALDLDDTHLSSAVHATATALPAAIATGERVGASLADVMTAYAIGFEVATFLGELLYPVHHDAAWHATAVFGTIGAAASAAALLRLDPDATAHALGLAATQAAGLRAMFGTMAKPFHAGRAATSGVMAAMLAARGFTTADEAFAGRQGLFRHLGAITSADIAEVASPQGCRRVLGNDFKLHACCHATHAAVDAALRLRSEHLVTVDRIRTIRIGCSRTVATVAANPDPRTGLEAKFSVAYAVLTALIDGDAARPRFTDDAVTTSRVRALLPLVQLEVIEGFDIREARVELVTSDGHRWQATTDAPRGSAANPATWTELGDKARSLMEPVIGPDAAEAIRRGVEAWPAGTLADLLELTVA
jgi:2-methylcitrate dehydratase PrpD